MKYIIRILCLIGLITASAYAGDVKPIPRADITVTTSGVVAVPKRTNRRYLLIVNTDDTNVVRISTTSINGANYATYGGIEIPNSHGYWEEDFYVTNSTWYATTCGIVSKTAVITVLEKE